MSKRSFFAELKRRHVYKVGAMYAVGGWLLVQMATQVFPFFDVPNAAVRLVVIVVVLGFPIALVLAWLYDLTPQGIVRTPDSADDEAAVVLPVRLGNGRKLSFALAGLLLLALAFVVAERTVLRPADAPLDRSLAVLPFESLSDDKANAYFAQGIQDEILTRLSRVGALRVISRNSTASLDSKPGDLPGIARRLGVAHLLEGSVQKDGDTVRINVQLIRADTDEHLWAETYDRKLDSIFGVEGEVAQAIADALNARLTGAETKALDQAATRNAAAYDAYLRGLSYELRFSDNQDYLDARRHYREAVKADPQFALAWVHLATTVSYLYLNGFGHDAQGLAELRDAADTAMRLQPDLGEAWLARGYYFYRGLGDFDAALAAFEQARRRLPNSADVNAAIAYVLRRQDRLNQAIANLKRATEQDPGNISHWTGISETEAALRRYDAAQAAIDRAIAISPENPGLIVQKTGLYQAEGKLDRAQEIIDALPAEVAARAVAITGTQMLYRRQYLAVTELVGKLLATPGLELGDQVIGLQSLLGGGYYFAGQREEANAAFTAGKNKALELRARGMESAGFACNLAIIEAGLGERAAALEEGEKCLRSSRGDRWQEGLDAFAMAKIEALAGEHEATLKRLESLTTTANALNPGDLRYSPVWDSVRDDPRFQKVLTASSLPLAGN
ncbi:tetratricopeptide repeat protein [Nevskia ramosa]|uniref:tetratricopeptide repeat protein n=1 Tax=Nevskia ramosa TaxID=64002 RepID=UPI003D127243